MAKEALTTTVAREYVAKFPNTPKMSIARKLYKENEKLYTDLEHARTMIRKVTGASGKQQRKESTNKSQFKPLGHQGDFKLPESYAEPKLPFKLPTACNNILCISDMHIPYHDVAAVTAALDYGVRNNINCVFINGDLLDFHHLSRFEKDPRKRSVKQEFDAARQMLEAIRNTFPTAPIYWLKGNHDNRYESWLRVKCPEIFDDEYYYLEQRLRLNELKITLIDDKQLVKAGKLFITHGHLIIKGVFAPVNSARGAYMRAKASIIIGHTHQVSNHVEKDLKGDIVSCWSQGCLCELQPDYDPFVNKHAHGFAHIIVDKGGGYSVENKMIYKGKIL